MSAQGKYTREQRKKQKKVLTGHTGSLGPSCWTAEAATPALQGYRSLNLRTTLMLKPRVWSFRLRSIHITHTADDEWKQTKSFSAAATRRNSVLEHRPCLERPPPPDLRHHFTKDPAHENSQVTEHLPTVGAERLTRVNCPYMPYYTQPILNFLTTLASTVYIKWKAA